MPQLKIQELKLLERPLLLAIAYLSGIIVAGMLIGLWRYGIDLGSVFLGTHWSSTLEQSKGTIAIEGAIVLVTLVVGSLFVFSVFTLLHDRRFNKEQPAKPEGESKSE